MTQHTSSSASGPTMSDLNKEERFTFYAVNILTTVALIIVGLIANYEAGSKQISDLKEQNIAALDYISKLESNYAQCTSTVKYINENIAKWEKETKEAADNYKSKYLELVENPKNQFEFVKSRSNSIYDRIKENRSKLNNLLGTEVVNQLFINFADNAALAQNMQALKVKSIAENNPEMFTNVVASQSIFNAIIKDFETLNQ